MRWLLCGGDGSKDKTTSVITEKYPAREFFPLRFHINSKKLKNRIELKSLQFKINSEKLNLHHVKSVIILAEIVRFLQITDIPGRATGMNDLVNIEVRSDSLKMVGQAWEETSRKVCFIGEWKSRA